MLRARVVSVVVACALVASACATETTSASKSVAPPAPSAQGGESHPPEWFRIGAAREDLQKSEAQMDASMSDCESACKALASLERAVNHICAVAEPDECNDARMRALKARKAVNAQCSGC